MIIINHHGPILFSFCSLLGNGLTPTIMDKRRTDNDKCAWETRGTKKQQSFSKFPHKSSLYDYDFSSLIIKYFIWELFCILVLLVYNLLVA